MTEGRVMVDGVRQELLSDSLFIEHDVASRYAHILNCHIPKEFSLRQCLLKVYMSQNVNIKFGNLNGVVSFGDSISKQQQLHKQVNLLSESRLMIK